MTQANDSVVTFQKNISQVYQDSKFDVEKVTEHSIIQSKKLGNCGMIAAMTSLANNRELINKVVPPNQNFKNSSLTDSKEVSEFVFNLYKCGKLHLVIVNESLTFWNDLVYSNRLYYSRCRNMNFVGPLLEKALIKLLFNCDYKLSIGVDALAVLTSFSNTFFEEFYETELDEFGYKLKDVMTYAKTTNSLMVVDFKNKVSQYRISDGHAYTLIDYADDIVKIYNPYGKHIRIPTSVFVENIHRLLISYTGNEIFKMPNIKTSLEFADSWNGSGRIFSHVDYDLTVEEDDTVVLINNLNENYSRIFRHVYVIPTNNTIIGCIRGMINRFFTFILGYPRTSLRAVLKRGKYKIRFVQEHSKYLQNDKNNFLFRFAASKQCIVKKC